MATFTITTAVNIDTLTSKAGGDTYNINGGYLTIDQDSRYGTNQGTSASWGPMTISDTLGGTCLIDSRAVKLIPYNTGSGNVPAAGTVITQSGETGTGILIGVWSAINVAPTAAAAAMPASGFIKVKQVSGTFATSGALTGIGASTNGSVINGWLEIVGDDASTCTVSRLGTFQVRGDWFDLGTTSGTDTTTYQLPTSGSIMYCPGVWVETAASSGVYEFYPCAGSLTATAANMATDEVRGKVCWISTAGLVRFSHDGTNTTGGYLPPSGRKVRVPNIFFMCCTTAARTANVLPNATLATRYDFTTTGAGVIDIDTASMCWYPSFAQAYSVTLNNVGIMSQLSVSEIASPLTWSQVGVGQEAATAYNGLLMSLCFAGGTMTDCTWTSATLAASGRYVVSITDITGFTFSGGKSFSLVARGNATTGNATITRATDCNWVNCKLGVGRHLLTGCTNCVYTGTVYWDHPSTTTATANPMYVWDLGTAPSVNMTFDGLTFGGLTLLQPYSGILNIGVAGCSNIKLRNIGTSASPLDLGGARAEGVNWSRVTTVATVTKIAHGLKVNDIIYVEQSTDVAAITVAAKTVASVPTADTFTFTAVNAGAASGKLTYYPTMSATPVVLLTGSAVNILKIQRVYTIRNRTNLMTGDNSAKNVYLENFHGDPAIGAPTITYLAARTKGLKANFSVAGQTSVYGTHFADYVIANYPLSNNVQAWSRTSNTITVSSNSHNLKTGDRIFITQRTNAAIPYSARSVTAANSSSFTFVANNSGTTSGTLSWHNMHGRFSILFNETTADTSDVFAITNAANGTPAFTSAGTVYMPRPTMEATWTTPYYVTGIDGFLPLEAVMAGGTIARYNMYYQIDKNDGAGYSSYRNLYLNKPGGGGTVGQYSITMTNTDGINVGDLVWGTNVANYNRVTGITNGTTIAVSQPNIGTVSGTLRFSSLHSETNINPVLGFKLRVKIRTITADTVGISSVSLFTKTSLAGQTSGIYTLDPVDVSITAKSASDASNIQNVRILLEADVGGTLPAYGATSSNVSITRSGSTATITHLASAHGLSSGQYVVIRGANQPEYNRIAQVTVSNTTVYTISVSGTPDTPGTGVIKAVPIIINANTNASGVITETFAYSGTDQPVKGIARKGSGAPYYKPGLISGTITDAGLTSTVFMVSDT